MKLIYTPIAILSGLLAGWVAQKAFDRLWALFDAEEAPEPDQQDASLPKLATALVVEGAVFSLTKGLVDRGARGGFARLTGRWPGEAQQSPAGEG
jgi:hypothetical protein